MPEQPQITVSVYPEHFVVSLQYGDIQIESESVSLSEALHGIAEEYYQHE